MRGTSSTRLAAAVGVLAAGVAAATPAVAVTRTVYVGSYYFEDDRVGDSQVVVTQGDRITFSFAGKDPHTATVNGLFSSGRRNPGQRWTTPPLTRAGTFTLYCQVHGARQHGTALIIRRKPSPAPSPTRARPTASPTKPPSPRPSTTQPSTRPSPTPSATVRAMPAAASPSVTPSRTPSASPSIQITSEPMSNLSAPPDVVPAGPLEDRGSGWLLPGAALSSVLLLGAAAVARRRRGRF